MRILIVDDEPQITRVLRASLQSNGHEVTVAQNGVDALAQFLKAQPDMVITDLAMPGMDGIELTREIRLRSQTPILVLSVRSQDTQKVSALDEGADDYITKPFSIPELAARLRSAVRRFTTALPDAALPIAIGNIELDPTRRTVRKAGSVLRLTPKEFDLLHYLMSHPGVPVSHVKLLRAVWGDEYGRELEYLRTFVHQLRKKLEDDPSSPEYLLTELHFGYRFRETS